MSTVDRSRLQAIGDGSLGQTIGRTRL